MNRTSYRPDIDGLRALAVLAVLFFHLGINDFSGGFAGVDIFFVISGFLITGLIRKEIAETGSFSFRNFYIRRVRRLAPALLFTLYITTLVAALLLSPAHLEDYGGSLLTALASVSNIFFWISADYFDTAAQYKPLLHTWSLSVEEQFYLFWPLLLLLCMKNHPKLLAPAVLLIMLVASLYLNAVFKDGDVALSSNYSGAVAKAFSDGRSTIFYLLPFRVFEFAIGGLLVFLPSPKRANRLIHELLVLLGLVLCIYSIVAYSEELLWPGFYALVPCIGTALIIFSGNHATLSSRLLTNPVSVGIGLISYSLYLVHWPLIVFWQYWTFSDLERWERIVISVLSILLAIVMYKYVEQPFRQQRAHRFSPKWTAIVSFSIILFFSVSLWTQDGWTWRTAYVDVSELKPPDINELRLESLEAESSRITAYTIGALAADTKRVLVIGDSHAGHLRGGAKYLAEKYNLQFVFYNFSGCSPVFGTYRIFGADKPESHDSPFVRKCREQIKRWEDYIQQTPFDYVFLASRWNWLFEPREYFDIKIRRDLLVEQSNPKFTVADSRRVFPVYLESTIKTIQENGAQVVIFGQVPHAGKDLEGCNNMPDIFYSDLNERCNHVPKQVALERSRFSDTTIRTIAERNQAIAVIPTDFFCDTESNYCRTIYKGIRLKDDDDHVNGYGSVYLAKRWEASSNFPFRQQATESPGVR